MYPITSREQGSAANVPNVGDAGGTAEVGIELDDVFVANWQSKFLD
jgi:hypothetical protein